MLYDRLPEWLALLHEEGSAVLTLPHGGDELEVDVERGQLLKVALGFYKALLQLIAQARDAGSGLVVQLSDRLVQLPGLAGELARLDDAEVVGLPAGHAACAALEGFDRIDGSGQVKLLRRMRWRADPVSAPGALRRKSPTRRSPRRTRPSRHTSSIGAWRILSTARAC